MWFKTLIIMFYMNYSDFMRLYGKMSAHQFKKNFFIHKAFIFKVICLLFFSPLLNENRVWGTLRIIIFFLITYSSASEFLKTAHCDPLVKIPGLFKSFLIIHSHCSSLCNIHIVTEKKKKENIPGGIHLQTCIGQARTSHSEWLFFFSSRQVVLPTVKTQLARSFRGNTYHKAAVHFNQGSQSILRAVIAS